jgi:hypothetical protein
MMPAHVALSLVSIAFQYDYTTGIKSMDHVESLSRPKFHLPGVSPTRSRAGSHPAVALTFAQTSP